MDVEADALVRCVEIVPYHQCNVTGCAVDGERDMLEGDRNILDESWSFLGGTEKRHHVMNSLEFYKLLRGRLDCDDFS